MKTIFVTSFHPHISRNILSTSAFSALRENADLRVVILVPSYKAEYFKSNFGGENIVIEGVIPFQASKTKLGLLFKKLGLFLFDTDTARMHKKYKFYHDKKLAYFYFSMAVALLGRSFLLRRLVRYLDFTFSPKGFFNDVLQKYNPSVIFSTDVQNENDVSLLQDAKRKGIQILGMLRSWDNPTQRVIRILPDRLLVGSRTLKDEVLEMYRYPADKITVTGNPHYDRYTEGPIKTREDFFAQFNLDPNKKLILYAPIGDHLVKYNDIDQFVMETLGHVSAQVLVRFPPDEAVTLVNFHTPKNMAYDKPGVTFKDTEFGDREIRKEDDDRLIDEIYYSDVIATGPTSISLDSALIDRPIITVNFYPSKRNLYDGVYTYTASHMQKLLGTHGVRHATTQEQFLKDINDYLRNPSLDTEGRAKIRSLWFSHADGRAGERVAHEIINFLNQNE